ncbi:DUF4381 domain-containing protein [Antarcticibacterium sp. 1MA-6-2]|uniref:DUF4381 domain-containing protein n=1 Tax=Antarcticibacterium sp. 1MA-6-2 TaxID=2908210 RepID=UPI001F357E14|nr:DUF4381 domain-containing protein [Antarcticibacterium sp. 1MA-6-2]UJH90262.1 DUF4381 domain-containing protein [Antarcticibacterium sp. 1MA-6-2]
MEVVESLAADTSRQDNGYRLIKEYLLTQFDSGSYTIPSQRVLINENPFYTDSLLVEVNDVVVDTTKQKMYAIKPAMEVPSGFSFFPWIWIILAVLVLAALVFFLLRRRKKRQEAAKQLPPYERALFELQQLDESHLLENRQTKEYYSKLTEAVRRYIEDEVHLRAMESTTSELILELEEKMKSGELKLSRQTIDDLKIILQRADLAKFANSRPDIITAKGDRSKIEFVIKDTKAAIPEPTEEELLKDEEYRQAQLRKKKRRKIIMASTAGAVIIVIAISVIISTRGFTYLTHTVFGNPTKELMEGEWISSEYGDPAVAVNTPRVLKRGEIELPDDVKAMMVGSETFKDGDLAEDLYVVLTTMKFNQGAKFDLDKAVEGIYTNLEQQGARNIIVKDEEFTTLEGVEGVKVFGTLEMEHPRKEGEYISKEYSILNFSVGGGFQQITVIYDEQDEFAEEIAGRIINSVEFIK